MRLATAALALLALALPASAQGRWLGTFAVPGIYGGDIDGGQVHAAVADGGGALIGGDFRTVDGTEAHGVARWTGMTWEPFGGGLRDADGTDGVAYAVARDHSGGVWVAGEFDAVVQPDGSTLSASGVARWTGDGWDVPCRLTGGMFGRPTVYAVLVVGGSVYLAGDFANLIRPGGSALGGSGVVRWTDGIWMSLGQRRQTTALAALPDGDILASGFFPGPDGEIGVGVERWNGSAWTPYTRTLGTFAIVLSLLVDEGDLYVGGLFSGGRTASNALVASRNVIRWDGQSWQPVGAGAGSIEPAGGEVRELALDGGGGLLVGGYVEVGFNADGSTVASPGLIRWTGSEWERRAISDASGQVTALGRLPEETIVGGRFALLRETGGATVRATRLAVLADEGGPRPFSARTGRDGTFFFSGSGQYVRLAPDGCGGVHVYAPEQAGPLASNGGSTSRRWSGTAWEPVPLALRQSGLFGLTADGPGPVVTVVASVPGSCDAFVVGGRFSGFVPSSGP